MDATILDASRRPWLDIAPEISGALVYLDAGAAEVVELSIGTHMLFGLGAASVCELERCSPEDAVLPCIAAAGQLPSTLAIFTTQLLTDAYQLILHALMVHHRSVTCCRIYSSLSQLAHAQAAASDLGVEAYAEFSAAVQQDLADARARQGLAPLGKEQQQQLRVSVRHLPLHLVALDESTFVLPAAAAAANMALSGGRAAGLGPVDLPSSEEEEAMGISGGLSLMAHALADTAGLLGVRLAPFACGPVSMALAKEFFTLPQPTPHHAPDDSAYGGERPGGGGPGGASSSSSSWALVLVDRSLDLATPCMHYPLDPQDAVHPLDVVLGSFNRTGAPLGAPPRGGGGPRTSRTQLRCADVRVEVPGLAPFYPLEQLSPSSSCSSSTAGQGAPARPPRVSEPGSRAGVLASPPMGLSLWQASDRRWLQWLAQLWPKRGKEAMLLLRKWLKEAIRQEKVAPGARTKLTSAVSPAELEGLVSGLVGAPPDVALRHQPLISLASAAAQALSGPSGTSWSALGALERQLLMALPQSSSAAEALLPTLLDAAETVQAGKGVLSVDDLLLLLVVVYSLSGDRNPPAPPLYSDNERQLRDALVSAIMRTTGAAAAAAAGGGAAEGAAAVNHLPQCLPDTWEWLLQASQHQQQEGPSRTLHPSDASTDGGGDPLQALKLQLTDRLSEVFGRLRWLAAARGKLRDVRRLMVVDADSGMASSTRPLVRQVLTKILLQADNRDLSAPTAAAARGLITRGLGFGLSAVAGMAGMAGINRPQQKAKDVSEYEAVLVFVVGGISAAEIREVRQELSEHQFGHQPKVILGGTSLLSAVDAARLLLAPNVPHKGARGFPFCML